jgi:tetratricopeptide (TPR) repeat protein
MDRLEDNLKRTMQVASVIGRDFAFRILQIITNMREELKSYLLNLQGLEFIYEKSLFPELEYIFKHALTQEVAYNSLLLKRRNEIHDSIGRAIEELYANRLEEFYEMLAYHYSKSNNQQKAYEYLKLSGEKAAGNYANWEAYGFYKDALAVLNRLPETEENKKSKIEILLLIGGMLLILGYPEDSLHILQEGQRLSEELEDKKSLGIFFTYIANLYNLKGDYLLAIEYGEKSFREAEKTKDIEVMVPIAMMLCSAYQFSGLYIKIIDMAPKVINLLEKTKRESDFFSTPLNPYSFFCGYYGAALGYLGNFDEGTALCEKGLRNAIETGDIINLGFSEVAFSSLFMVKGDGKLTVEHAQNGIRYSEEANWPLLISMTLLGLGCGYYFLGNLESAQENIEKGLKIYKDSGVEAISSASYYYLSMVLYDLGNLQKAQINAEKALELSQRKNERHFEGRAKIALGRILGHAVPSQKDQGEEYILQGIKIHEELKLRPVFGHDYHCLGELYADTGQKVKALENLKKAETEFKIMGMDYWLARTYAVYTELYKNEGDQPKAKENLNKAIGIFKECGADGWVKKYEKELAALS